MIPKIQPVLYLFILLASTLHFTCDDDRKDCDGDLTVAVLNRWEIRTAQYSCHVTVADLSITVAYETVGTIQKKKVGTTQVAF